MFLNVLIESPIKFSLGALLGSDFVFASKSSLWLCFSKEKSPSCFFLFLIFLGWVWSLHNLRAVPGVMSMLRWNSHGIATPSMAPAQWGGFLEW